MTTIQPYWEPRAEAREAVAAPTSNGNRRLAWFAGAALLALTAVNLAATAYLASAIAELRATEERLAKLSSFERRIMERLELFNVGVQSQFDNMLQVTEGRMAELRRTFEQARREPAVDTSGPDDDMVSATGLDSGPVEAEAEPVGPTLVEVPGAAGRRLRQPAPVPAPNPAYERIEGPGGKVTYRKLR